MKAINFKAIVAGIAAALGLSLSLSLVGSVLLMRVVDAHASGVNFADTIQSKDFVVDVVLDPLAIVFVVVGALIGAGVPSYLAAFLARRHFVLHSMLIGLFIALLCLADWEVVKEFPLLAVIAVVMVLAIALGAGNLRKRQVANNAG